MRWGSCPARAWSAKRRCDRLKERASIILLKCGQALMGGRISRIPLLRASAIRCPSLLPPLASLGRHDTSSARNVVGRHSQFGNSPPVYGSTS